MAACDQPHTGNFDTACLPGAGIYPLKAWSLYVKQSAESAM
jgi:hypothetical protein